MWLAYVVAVSDTACAAAAGGSGSMVCQHAFPYYNQVPNAGTIGSPSSALCSQNLTSIIPAYVTSASSTSWSLVNPSDATQGVVMSVTSGTGCPTTGSGAAVGGMATVANHVRMCPATDYAAVVCLGGRWQLLVQPDAVHESGVYGCAVGHPQRHCRSSTLHSD